MGSISVQCSICLSDIVVAITVAFNLYLQFSQRRCHRMLSFILHTALQFR